MTSGLGQFSMCGLMVPNSDSTKPWLNMSILENAVDGCTNCCESNLDMAAPTCAAGTGGGRIHGANVGGMGFVGDAALGTPSDAGAE